MNELLFKDIAEYDYCLVFPTNEKKDFTDHGKIYMENIQALGYETYIFRVDGMKKRTCFDYVFGGCGIFEGGDDEDDDDDDTASYNEDDSPPAIGTTANKSNAISKDSNDPLNPSLSPTTSPQPSPRKGVVTTPFSSSNNKLVTSPTITPVNSSYKLPTGAHNQSSNTLSMWSASKKGDGLKRNASQQSMKSKKSEILAYYNRKMKKSNMEECLIFVLLRTPLHKLREFAERMEIKMLLDPSKSKELLADGDPEHNIKRVVLKHDPKISPINPYECIYSKYKKNREFLYWKGDSDLLGNGRGQDDLATTDNISRYYTVQKDPIGDNHMSLPVNVNMNMNRSRSLSNASDASSSINDNENVYPFNSTFSAGSLSSYNPPGNNGYRNHYNSAILRNHPFRDLLRIKISTFMLQSRPRIIKQNYV
jgi:hypothetical protein